MIVTYESDPISQWLGVPIKETYSDRALDGVLKKMAAASFKEKLIDSNCTSKKIGNTYTASVFFGIASLNDRVGGRGELSPGKQITVFSNRSGAIATMYGLTVRESTNNRFTVPFMVKVLLFSQLILNLQI